MPDAMESREEWIDQLDKWLQRHDELSTKLSSVESSSSSAKNVISEARKSLESRLLGTKISSTVGSAVSIVGGVLTFTPFFALGAGLLAVGGLTSAGSAVANALFFEKGAAETFGRAAGDYNSTYEDLQNRIQEIENAKAELLSSFAAWLAQLQNPPLTPGPPGPGPNGKPPGPVKPPTSNPTSNYAGNAFQGFLNGTSIAKPWLSPGTKTAAQVAELLAQNGGAVGRVLGSQAPKVIKFLPGLSIIIDVYSIASTWTGSNETLQKADKLMDDIQKGTEALRQLVAQYVSALEELVGGPLLQDALRRLMRMRNAVPGKPRGTPPPVDPGMPCKVFKTMRSMPKTPFLLFGSMQGEHQEDMMKNSYVAELVQEDHVLQLTQKVTTAGVVDSLFESYPDTFHTSTWDDESDDEPQVVTAMAGPRWTPFRSSCSFVYFGKEKVHNVSGSSIDHRAKSWVGFWQWIIETTAFKGCSDKKCYINLASTAGKVDQHSDMIVGGHMEPKKRTHDKQWYILPICQRHNAPAGTFDRGKSWMVTEADAYAIEISPHPSV